jgi:hydroxymethylpyrimidine pyrophosphatase-like HAD family hydrolase
MMGSMDSKRPTIAVDFDGVIADYDGWEGQGSLGQPRKDVLEALTQLREEGWKIVVYSCRAATDIDAYLVANGVPFDEINANSSRATKGPKPSASVYWDDRAVRYSGNALADLTEIRNFRTWNGRR